MNTQDRTIRDVIEIEFEDLAIDWTGHNEEKYIIKQFMYEKFKQLLKQPEKQEIEKLDISHEVTVDMACFNDVVYNRDCIIELQKVVNKLLEK